MNVLARPRVLHTVVTHAQAAKGCQGGGALIPVLQHSCGRVSSPGMHEATQGRLCGAACK
jgi:hypothetical protein